MLAKQILAALTIAGVIVAPTAFAQESPAQATSKAGFYGGVALRDAGSEAAGIDFGHLASTWNRFAQPATDESTRRTLVFGGYRWANDVAVEGSFSSADSYALRPFDASTRRGVGLSLADSPDVSARTWNANVYTSWSFLNSFSLYGRLGYAQSDSPPGYALATLPSSDPRRSHDGVNYGVGVRYDITSALGLRLEYARFPRFIGEALTGPLPDSDQVQFGMQFRF
ncbi:MAG: porin family protein [Pseudomonadota bacterium]|nr:porin family protein [Pseudomonadota bacterium]